MSKEKQGIWRNPILSAKVTSPNVKPPEMLTGYLIGPFEGAAKTVWAAIAYNLYYAVAFPIYNTASSTLAPVSTCNSGQRATLDSFTNIAGLGASYIWVETLAYALCALLMLAWTVEKNLPQE